MHAKTTTMATKTTPMNKQYLVRVGPTSKHATLSRRHCSKNRAVCQVYICPVIYVRYCTYRDLIRGDWICSSSTSSRMPFPEPETTLPATIDLGGRGIYPFQQCACYSVPWGVLRLIN